VTYDTVEWIESLGRHRLKLENFRKSGTDRDVVHRTVNHLTGKKVKHGPHLYAWVKQRAKLQIEDGR